MKRFLLTILFFCCALAAHAGTLTVDPPQTVNGGTVLLRWEGDMPSSAVARFDDRVFYLKPVSEGAVGALGIDVGLLPGTYPLTLAVVDRHGETEFIRQRIGVRSAQRPEERLTVDPELASPKDPATLERIAREKERLTELFAGQRDAPLWPDLRLPVDDPVSSEFGLRRVFNGQPKSPHSGTDFRSPRGTPVTATAPGTVALTGELFYTGKTVVVDHGEGLFTLYAHLESLAVSAGDNVTVNTLLGRVGSTGRSTGPHLHWTMRLHGALIDPLEFVRLWNRENP